MAEETLIQRLYRQAGQAVADSADAAGTYVAKRLDTQLYPDDMREFQTAPPSEYAQFLEAAWQAMDMPVVKIGDQAISPDQYLRMAARISSPLGPSLAGTFMVEKAVVSMITWCLRDTRLR